MFTSEASLLAALRAKAEREELSYNSDEDVSDLGSTTDEDSESEEEDDDEDPEYVPSGGEEENDDAVYESEIVREHRRRN